MFICLAGIAHKKRINMSALGIGVDFLQIMSIFTSFQFKWPIELKSLFAYASATTYNDELMAPECSVSTWSFLMKWWMVQALPMTFILILVVLLCVQSGKVRCCCRPAVGENVH